MSLTLPTGCTHGVWYPCDDGSGTTITDLIDGNDVSLGGTTTNAWDNPGGVKLTNGADVTLLLVGAYFDAMLRIDNLEGSLLVGCQLYHDVVPAIARQMWFSYGRINNTNSGGYAFSILTSGGQGFSYGVIGTPNQNHPLLTTATDISATEQGTYFGVSAVINRFANKETGDLEFSIWGYFNGVQDYSSLVPALDTNTPIVDSGTGGRFGARGLPSSLSDAEFGGEAGQNARMRHCYALRFSGDYRHNLPKYAYQMARLRSGTPPFLRT